MNEKEKYVEQSTGAEIICHSAEELEFYVEDDIQFADLMNTFLKCMNNAYKNGGLYVDKIVSKEEE